MTGTKVTHNLDAWEYTNGRREVTAMNSRRQSGGPLQLRVRPWQRHAAALITRRKHCWTGGEDAP